MRDGLVFWASKTIVDVGVGLLVLGIVGIGVLIIIKVINK